MQQFFEKIKKALQTPDQYDDYLDTYPEEDFQIQQYETNDTPEEHLNDYSSQTETDELESPEETDASGTFSQDIDLPVDVYQTEQEIVIRAFVPATPPSQLDITISRDMVTIAGSREPEHEIAEEDYFYRELAWGSFSRRILLPQEVDLENASAHESKGLLTIRLPKLNKAKKMKLKVRAGRG